MKNQANKSQATTAIPDTDSVNFENHKFTRINRSQPSIQDQFFFKLEIHL